MIVSKIRNNKFLNNLSWILAGNVLHAVLSFVLNIYVARILTKYDYGVINYSASLIAFASAITQLGINAVITKYFAEDERKAGTYIYTALIFRFFASILAVSLILVYVHFSGEENSVFGIVFIQAISIVFSSIDMLMHWYRYNHKAKLVALVRFVSFSISAAWRVIILVFYKNLMLYVVGVALEPIIFNISLLILYTRENRKGLKFSMDAGKKMLKISYPFVFSAILITIYAQTDKLMLNSMLSKEAVALYSIATTIAGAISIIPTALIEGFRPEIMRYKVSDKILYERRLKQLYALVFWMCITYGLFITVFAKQILMLLYQDKYLDAKPALALVVWYTSFSYFGAINNIYMVSEERTKWVQFLTLFGAICNVILNWILIPIMGIQGAALASLLTQFFANFLMLLIIPDLRDNFRIIVQSIMLRGIKR